MKPSVGKALGSALQGWQCYVPRTGDGYEGPEDMGEQIIGLPRERIFQGEMRTMQLDRARGTAGKRKGRRQRLGRWEGMGLGDPGENTGFRGSFVMHRSNGSCFTEEEMCTETFHSHPKVPQGAWGFQPRIPESKMCFLFFRLCPEDLSLTVLTRCFK